MTKPSDFSNTELNWLVKAGKPGVAPPKEIEAKLINSGVVDRTDLGLKITGLGKIILEEARNTGQLRQDGVSMPKGPGEH